MAKEACEQGRVFINGKLAKSGDEVKVEDIVQVNFGTNSMKIEVLSISDNVRKDEAMELYKPIE